MLAVRREAARASIRNASNPDDDGAICIAPVTTTVSYAGSLNRRVAILAGFISAAGYLFAYLLARHQLQGLSHPDPILIQDLTQAPIYVLKAVMMIFSGAIAGAIGSFARELVGQVREQELKRVMVSRLFGEYLSDEVREKLNAAVTRGDAEAIRCEGHGWSGKIGLSILTLADEVEAARLDGMRPEEN